MVVASETTPILSQSDDAANHLKRLKAYQWLVIMSAMMNPTNLFYFSCITCDQHSYT